MEFGRLKRRHQNIIRIISWDCVMKSRNNGGSGGMWEMEQGFVAVDFSNNKLGRGADIWCGTLNKCEGLSHICWRLCAEGYA